MPVSEIFLSDVAAACDKLKPSGAERDSVYSRIAELLGFESRVEQKGEVKQTATTSVANKGDTQLPPKPSPGDVGSVKDEPEEQPPDQPPSTELKWVQCTIETRTLDESFQSHYALASGSPLATETVTDTTAVLEPLFEPTWSRAIFTSLMATYRADDIDVEKLIESVARCEEIEDVPRKLMPTLRRGAQVLVDVSTAMTPFFADQIWALNQIESVVGWERVKTFSFSGTPERGVGMDIFEEVQPYVAPPQGTPVILLSDLGIGRPPGSGKRASADEWLAFAQRVRRSGCRLMALLPYKSSRWPQKLQRDIDMFHWDPRTTVGRVRSVIGRPQRAG